jgi:hypothetical protein
MNVGQPDKGAEHSKRICAGNGHPSQHARAALEAVETVKEFGEVTRQMFVADSMVCAGERARRIAQPGGFAPRRPDATRGQQVNELRTRWP